MRVPQKECEIYEGSMIFASLLAFQRNSVQDMFRFSTSFVVRAWDQHSACVRARQRSIVLGYDVNCVKRVSR